MIVSGNNERFSENFFKLEIGLVCGFSLYGGKARLQGDFFSDGRISLIYSFLTEGDVTGDVLRRRQHLIAIHSLLTKGDDLSAGWRGAPGNFNPLPSHEGRQQPLPVFHPILPHFIIHIDRITSLSPSNSSVCAHIFRKLHYSSPVRISWCFCVHLGFAPRSLFQSAMAQTLPGS